MTAEALSVKTDETQLVKPTVLTTNHGQAAPAVETTYVYGYEAAANVLRDFHAPYSTPEALKSICSKIRLKRRHVPHFPLPVVHGQTVIFDRRRLAAWAIWRNGGPAPTAIYKKVAAAEARQKLSLRRIEAEAERELKQLLMVLASTDHDGAQRLSTNQMRVLVRRFKDLLFEYDWNYATNGPRSAS